MNTLIIKDADLWDALVVVTDPGEEVLFSGPTTGAEMEINLGEYEGLVNIRARKIKEGNEYLEWSFHQ